MCDGSYQLSAVSYQRSAIRKSMHRIVGILAQLLSSYLLIWAPGTFAMELLTALPSVGVRGPAAWIELTVHGVVAITCAAGG